MNVNGFATVINHTTDSVADWVLTISGSRLCVGEQVTLEYTVSLAEFANLGDPIILGMPFIDLYGGVNVTRTYVYLADLYVNRLRDKRSSRNAVSSISFANAPRSYQGPLTSNEGNTHVIDSSEWRVIPTYWNSIKIREQLGTREHYWVEP